MRAKRYAPVTLDRAAQLLAAAEAAIREDRYAIADAEVLADQAAATARHAGQIAEIVRERPNLEELILEWESYLTRLQTAARMALPADSTPGEVTDVLEREIERMPQLRQDLADSQAFARALEEEIRALDEQLGALRRNGAHSSWNWRIRLAARNRSGRRRPSSCRPRQPYSVSRIPS